MKRTHLITILSIASICLIGYFSFAQKQLNKNEKFVTYEVDAKKSQVRCYWKNDRGEILGSLSQLKMYVERKKDHLLFAMNGGMYQEDRSPLGLYIENGKQLSSLNTLNGKGNFYLKPNGVFYLTKKNEAVICNSTAFKPGSDILFATQSGPMLLLDGKIHPEFKEGSVNLNIRNGVGILPDGRILFAMSKHEVNFYDFAMYFKTQGCKNALYLDGFVSRTYAPSEKWIQTDGDFGVMIGVTDYQPIN